MDEQIAQLIGFGATAAQARAALKACKGDFAEAASAVVEGRFADAKEDDAPVASTSKAGKAMSIDDDEDEDNQELGDGDSDGYAFDADDDDADDFDDMMAADSDDDNDLQQPVRVDQDAYGKIEMSKDRRETVIEIEEPTTKLRLKYPPTPAHGQEHEEEAKILSSGKWLSGCPEGSEQGLLFQLYHQLREGNVRCPWDGCSGSIARKEQDFFAVPASFTDYLARLAEVNDATCPSCKRRFCLACGEKNSAVPDSTSKGKSKASSTAFDYLSDRRLFHCADLQAVILGVGLLSVQDLYLTQNEGPRSSVKRNKGASSEEEATGTAAKKAKTGAATYDSDSAADSDDGGIVSSLTGLVKTVKAPLRGKGYAGNATEDRTGREAALKVQAERDRDLRDLMLIVRNYIPNRNRSWGVCDSDHLPGLQTLAHIRRRFNPLASDLLSRDSLAEMCSRAELYTEFFEWLEVIAAHENLCSIMAQPIMRIESITEGPTNKSTGTTEKTIIYAGSAGPRELMGTLDLQAKASQRGLRNVPTAADAPTTPGKPTPAKVQANGKVVPKASTEQEQKDLEEKRRVIDFADRIVKAVTSIDRSLVANKGETFVANIKKSYATTFDMETLQGSTVKMSDKEIEDVYVKWAKAQSMSYVDMEAPTPPGQVRDPERPTYLHYFAKDIAASHTAGASAVRGAAIGKEHGVLITNVPVAWASSIFVRADESRSDVFKVLITGPPDTPYWNGCYAFDFFLPAAYNRQPPMGKYMTTNGGKHRFNPNLYADGKICLSLLGTWTGPGWVPGSSTLLQVLISIQSMILVDEPILNEPGHSHLQGTAQSKAYDCNTRRMVIETAMLGQLLDPPFPFKEVIHTHFKLKSREIRKQLATWVKEDDGGATMADGVQAMRRQPGSSGKSSAMKTHVKEINKLLDRLDAGEDITGTSSIASTSAAPAAATTASAALDASIDEGDDEEDEDAEEDE